MIKELTKEQEDSMQSFVDKWVKIGLGTERPGPDALTYVNDFYKEGGLEPPARTVVVPSIEAALNVDLGTGLDQKESRKLIWSARIGLSFWAGYKARCDFYNSIDPTLCAELVPTLKLSEHFCYAFTFDELLILIEKPTVINLNEAGELHSETGRAIQWSDGTGFNFIDGSPVPDWLFDVPKEELDASRIMGIKNVDERTTTMRWYGLEHLLDQLDYEVLDEMTESNEYKTYHYKLINLDVGLGEKRTYLYMENPSCDEKHVEGVKAKTVKEALEFRIPDRQKKKYGYKPAIARA